MQNIAGLSQTYILHVFFIKKAYSFDEVIFCRHQAAVVLKSADIAGGRIEHCMDMERSM